MPCRVSGSWWMALAAAGVVACSDGTGRLDPDDNEPPKLVTQRVTTAEDTPIEIRVLDGVVDPEGDTLQVTAASAPDHTVEVMEAATLRVTPRRDFHGQLFVSYKVSDGFHSSTGSAFVIVTDVDDPPIGVTKSLTVRHTSDIVLEGSDVDTVGLSYEIATPPTNGTLTIAGATATYTAASGFTGDDAFTYRVHAGAGISEQAVIRLHVVRGTAPVATAGAVTGFEDQPVDLVLRASDIEFDPLTFTIVTQPLHGTLTGTPPRLTYHPAADFSGHDSLTFTASDLDGASNPTSFGFDLVAVNDAPVATPQSVSATEDDTRSITLAGSDVEGSALTFQVGSPAHGTLTGTGPTLTYTPAANYHGPDAFTFRAFDGAAFSAPATVAIDVAGLADPPVALPVVRTLSEDVPAAITLLGSDPDGDVVTYAIVAAPTHGTLSGSAPALSYAPAANYNGPDSFTYTVSDGETTTAAATVTITVNPVNDAPVATDDAVVTAEDTPATIALHATDVENQPLSFSIVQSPIDGTLSGAAPNLMYTPARNATGTRSFTFRASDGLNSSAQATVTIQITPVNDPPVTVEDFAFSEPGGSTTFAVVANDTDPEGDAVTLDSAAAPAHGDVEIVDGKLRYTPDAGFTGIELVTYTAIDSNGATATGQAHVGVGEFPVGVPLEVIAAVGGTISSTSGVVAPAISGDGRFVAMVSTLALLPDDTNGRSDVYLFDRGNQTFTRVSGAPDGGPGTGSSFRPHISASGRYVVFDSSSNNLVAGDSNGVADVFRFDRVTGTTIRISVATDGGQASGGSQDAEVSDDGNLVVFASLAFDLVATDVNGVQDVFVRDVTAGTTTRVSVTSAGGNPDLAASEPAISGDGRVVAFASAATNLVAGDLNNVSDIFVRDLAAATTTRVSVSSTGGEANGACLGPALSRDGRIIAFRSSARNLVGGPPPAGTSSLLYVRDVQQQLTTLPIALTSVDSVRLSADGRYVTAFAFNGVFLRDRIAGVSASLPGSSSWLWPMLSRNGRYLVALDASTGRAIAAPNPL